MLIDYSLTMDSPIHNFLIPFCNPMIFICSIKTMDVFCSLVAVINGVILLMDVIWLENYQRARYKGMASQCPCCWQKQAKSLAKVREMHYILTIKRHPLPQSTITCTVRLTVKFKNCSISSPYILPPEFKLLCLIKKDNQKKG